MAKRLRDLLFAITYLPLLASGHFGFAAAGPVLESPWSAVEIPHHGYRGVWENAATGHWLQVDRAEVTVFHALGGYCIEDPGFVPAFALYRLERGTDAKTRLETHYYDYRAWPDLLQAPMVYAKRQRLPESCENALERVEPSTAEMDLSLVYRSVYQRIVQHFDYFYPFFAERGVNWDSLKAAQLEKADAMRRPGDLFTRLENLLRPLNDGHVTLALGDRFFSSGRPALRARLAEHWKRAETDLEEQAWVSAWHSSVMDSVLELIDGGKLKRGAAGALEWGTIDGSIGYVRVNRFGGFSSERLPRPEQYQALENALQRMRSDLLKTERLIVDVAMNGGGSDAAALMVASYFADQRRKVLTYETRHGNRQDLFLSAASALGADNGAHRESRPVYLLTSEITASAAESFVLIMRAFPHVTQVGGATRGGLSSLLPKPFAGGLRLTLAYQRVLDAEGSLFEGQGVPPNRPLDLFPDDDVRGGLVRALRQLAGVSAPKGHQPKRNGGQ